MARNSHGTGTPGRMNEALGRDALGFIARQTVQTQDFREAIYGYPDGKQGHWVRNTHSETFYWVGDLTGGSTFEPGSIVFVASRSGKRGEKIIGSSPAGMVSASVATVTAPASVGPISAPLTEGTYSGWSYFGDGSSYVYLACAHHKKQYRYVGGANYYVSGTVQIRVSRIAVGDIIGQTNLAPNGYSDDEFLGGVGGVELFRSDPVDLVADPPTDPETGITNDPGIPWRTCALSTDGTNFFVVYTKDDSASTFTVDCYDASGTLQGTDTFTGRTPPHDQVDLINEHSAIVSGGLFVFAHPIGSAKEFTFTTRGTDAAIIDSLVIDFAANDVDPGVGFTGSYIANAYSGIAAGGDNSAAISIFTRTGYWTKTSETTYLFASVGTYATILDSSFATVDVSFPTRSIVGNPKFALTPGYARASFSASLPSANAVVGGYTSGGFAYWGDDGGTNPSYMSIGFYACPENLYFAGPGISPYWFNDPPIFDHGYFALTTPIFLFPGSASGAQPPFDLVFNYAPSGGAQIALYRMQPDGTLA